MSFLSNTSRSLFRSSRTISSRSSSIPSSSIRSISSSSTPSASSSSRSIQYVTLGLATFGLASTLLSNSIRLDDSSSKEKAKRKSYHERMSGQHKQAPIPSFAREKAQELEEVEEEQESEEDGEEDQAQSAYDPATGQINWDCPCLGGMADGPCGPQFKEAFSCFVFSEKEPKGIECVDKFKLMQDCFREYPETYKEEIEDEERGLEEEKLEEGNGNEIGEKKE